LEETTDLEAFGQERSLDQSLTSTMTKEFDEIFAEAVYETLSWTSCFVAPVLHVYLHDAMASEIGLRKSKLSIQDARDLENGLEKIFGFGAKIVEYRILGTLYTKLRLKEQLEQNFKFSSEVEKARKLYESRLGAIKRSADEK
jgi:hypothetical protein